MIRGRLPIGMEISEKYEPPSNGRFSLYGTQEDVDHISFGGHLARSCGVCMHQMLNCDMSPTNFASFFAILQSRLSPSYRTIWICFTAQSWRFGWFAIRWPFKEIPSVFGCLLVQNGYLQLWVPIVRRRDKVRRTWLGLDCVTHLSRRRPSRRKAPTSHGFPCARGLSLSLVVRCYIGGHMHPRSMSMVFLDVLCGCYLFP